MDKSRAMPILAGAAMAFSLAACQGMGWGESGSGQSSSMQGSSSYPQSGTSQSASASGGGGGMAQQQAAAPALVRDVQRSLGSRGYDPGAVDGVYGSGTEAALRRFQRDQNMASSGQIDAPTLMALGLTNQAGAPQRSGAAYTPTNQRQGAPVDQRQGAMALPSGQVRDVQQGLADRGYDAGPVDGQMGPRTRQALRDFQRDRNLQASGQPDQRTLAALGIEAGGAGTQTGEMPAGRQGEPPPPDIPDQVPEQQGELPPTGSQAPGSAPESSREPGIPGQVEPPPASGPAGQ